MGIFITICLIIIIAVIILIRKKKKIHLKNEKMPNNLGFVVADGKALPKLLHSSLPSQIEENLKRRMLENHHNWDFQDFEWRYYELKRYFIMNQLLKTVPMFSKEVDEVWHEMLMFTKDYETFSNSFYGSFLHHTPNMDVTPIPNERAFFDWIYLSLFEHTYNSQQLWGYFLKNPINQNVLVDFRDLTEDELLHKYFNDNGQWTEVKTFLINKMKSEIGKAEKMDEDKLPFKKVKSENQYKTLLVAAVYFSLFAPESYADEMSGLLPIYIASGNPSGTSCSGHSCTSTSKDSDSGSSSCSSGCSSCGSGCS